jgi:hypothetical protein
MTADRVNLPLIANHCERGANHLDRRKPTEWPMVNGLNGFFLFLTLLNIQGVTVIEK